MEYSNVDRVTKKLIITHNAGFFSCCTIRLIEIINYFNKFHKAPEVDSSAQWEFYKDEAGDITNKLFKINNINIDYEKDVDNKDHQFENYSTKINFDEVSDFIKKYFSPSDVILNIERYLIEKYNIDFDKTIAVCYRGGDKKIETNIPSYLEMIKKVKNIKEKYPDYKILVQSDEIRFYNLIETMYPDIINFDEIYKLKPNCEHAIQYCIPTGHKLPQAQLFLSIVQIISKCSKVIINSGNVGMWICYYRNNTDGVSQYVSKYIHDKENLDTDYWSN